MPTLPPECIAYGVIVSFVVDFLKRVPWLSKYPKIAAFVIGIALQYLPWLHAPTTAIAQIIACALLVLAGSTATHEILTQPVLEPIATAIGLKTPKNISNPALPKR